MGSVVSLMLVSGVGTSSGRVSCLSEVGSEGACSGKDTSGLGDDEVSDEASVCCSCFVVGSSLLGK